MREVITLPAEMLFGSFDMRQQTFDMDEVSDTTGDVDTLIYGHPRWRVSMSAMRDLNLVESSVWERIQMKLKGKQNRLAVFDPVRIAPRGTMRGTVTLNASVTAGAESAVINAGGGQAGTTILTGDLLQIGDGMGTSQLVKLIEDTTLNGSGVGTIYFGSYLRTAFASGVTVKWDRPLAYFAAMNPPSGWSYSTNASLVSGFAFDLLEQWS